MYSDVFLFWFFLKTCCILLVLLWPAKRKREGEIKRRGGRMGENRWWGIDTVPYKERERQMVATQAYRVLGG